jgi:exodeoxyribonuclease VII large subunit
MAEELFPALDRPAGIDGSELAGPFPVGEYAAQLRARLRAFARVQVFGELSNLNQGRARVYFELRDSRGALPCSMWRDDWEKLALPPGALANGAEVVVGGGTDYYVGSSTASPSFTFHVTALRIAGEGDLLAQIEARRRKLAAEGLLEPQKRLHRPVPPRASGVVTGEGGKARDDVVAGLRRQGWAGRIVWGFAPVQDRRAAPSVARALRELASVGEVDVIVVARGGGSPVDLMAFSDELLCRTVAHLPVPVVCSIGHHTDRTLLDDVAAESCSTPTHAAQVAVGMDCTRARADLARVAARLDAQARRAVLGRARHLAALSRAPAEHIARHRARLHQLLRELRAIGRRRGAEETIRVRRRLVVLERNLARASGAGQAGRVRDLERLSLALAAHDPERTLQRGYALVEDDAGELLTSAAETRAAGRAALRFHDGRVRARIEE